MSAAPRVLIADGRPATHAILEPLLRRAGWTVLTVASSVEVTLVPPRTIPRSEGKAVRVVERVEGNRASTGGPR